METAFCRSGRRCSRSKQASGGPVYFYYPRLQAASAAAETVEVLASGVNATLLHAEFEAMAYTDANDGQIVVSYRLLRSGCRSTGVLISAGLEFYKRVEVGFDVGERIAELEDRIAMLRQG